jgi:hypothetical protein
MGSVSGPARSPMDDNQGRAMTTTRRGGRAWRRGFSSTMSFDNAPILHERQEPDSMLCAQVRRLCCFGGRARS